MISLPLYLSAGGGKMSVIPLGYDTTANTMIFACVVLALDEALQNRVIEELDRICSDAAAEGREELSYTHDFPKFQYMVAFLVIRFLPPTSPI